MESYRQYKNTTKEKSLVVFVFSPLKMHSRGGLFFFLRALEDFEPVLARLYSKSDNRFSASTVKSQGDLRGPASWRRTKKITDRAKVCKISGKMKSGAVTFDETEKARGGKKKSPTFRNFRNETVIG